MLASLLNANRRVMVPMTVKNAAKNMLLRSGITAKRTKALYASIDRDFWPIYRRCAPFTLTSIERMYALYKAVQYAVVADIKGDFVECGVWKGGSSMVAALSFQRFGDTTRRMYLYDTYAGMSEPTASDVDADGREAIAEWRARRRSGYTDWTYGPLDQVKANMRSTGYPMDRILFVEGTVEDTIPDTMPDTVAILRLDTDWYESTYHELMHLFPLLSERGVLLIDDYGRWQGARKAVDQYLREQNLPLLLNRVDETGVIGVKS